MELTPDNVARVLAGRLTHARDKELECAKWERWDEAQLWHGKWLMVWELARRFSVITQVDRYLGDDDA